MVGKRRLAGIAWESLDNLATVVLTTEEMRWLLNRWPDGREALKAARVEFREVMNSGTPEGGE